ncbi:MAG: hypothetical protein H0W53_21530 [Acidobacteria bacterium]|nr:hypothetical protein [Acidobacteriota bacterium]
MPPPVPATAQADSDGATARLAAIARQDFEDIASAGVVVVFNPPAACTVGRGGRHVETGYALGKRVVLVGARGNVFHWLPEIPFVPDGPALSELVGNRVRVEVHIYDWKPPLCIDLERCNVHCRSRAFWIATPRSA